MAVEIAGLSQEEVRAALAEFEQAASQHEQWADAVNATLVCRLSPDPRDILPEAHRRCRFGQWYQGLGAERLGRTPSFLAIDANHQRAHQLAANLLSAMRRGEAAAPNNYRNFLDALKYLRLQIMTLRRELEDALFSFDPLTGVASRIGMLATLREQQELVRRSVQSCSLAMMDIDHFKEVNDTYGHVVGDRVLASLMRFALAGVRPYDRIFRYGGEEFLFCAPATDLKAAYELVERLRLGMAKIAMDGGERGSFQVTVSFGLALLDPDAPVEQSIERADKALYAAKALGRNRAIVWDVSMGRARGPLSICSRTAAAGVPLFAP